MESVNHTDDSQLNIQNDYFNTARKNRTRVTVVLTTGQRISGMIRSFDRFTLILDTRHGDQMVFKHAIATVAPAQQGDRDQRSRPPRRGDRGDSRPRPSGGRPQHGGPGGDRDGAGRGDFRHRATRGPDGKSFGNFMDLSAVSGGATPGGKPGSASAGGSAPKDGSRPAAETKPAAPAGPAAKPESTDGAQASAETKPAAPAEPAAKPAPKDGEQSSAETKPAAPAPEAKPSGKPEGESSGSAEPPAGTEKTAGDPGAASSAEPSS